MTRYVKQRDKYSCGPVSIMNALKWSGLEFAYDEKINLLQKRCRCVPPEGTDHADFDKALRTTAKRLKVRRVQKPKLWQIEEHLRAGGSIILNYSWERNDGIDGRHFIFLSGVSDTGKSFLIVNEYQNGPAVRRRTRKKLKSYNLRFQRTDPYYKAWFISIKD